MGSFFSSSSSETEPEVELDEDSSKDSDVPRLNVGGVLDPNGGVLSPMADGVEAVLK